MSARTLTRRGLHEALLTRAVAWWNPPVVDEASSTNVTFSTLANPDGDGRSYRLAAMTANGSLVVAVTGIAQVLLVGGGGGASAYTGLGAGGYIIGGIRTLPSGTLTSTIGAGGTINSDAAGGTTSLGTTLVAPGGGNGPGGAGNGTYLELTSTITGSSQKYAGSGLATLNATTTYGSGARQAGSYAGQAGVIYVRWEL